MATGHRAVNRSPHVPGATAPRAYRVAEAADLLGVSARAVRPWAGSGKLASELPVGNPA